MDRRLMALRAAMASAALATLALAGCATSGGGMSRDAGMMGPAPATAMMAMNPATSPHAAIDRFGSMAHLQMRDAMNGLPGPDQPVDFDKPPFVTTGLGPKGETVMYYNFDVQSTTPAQIYVLYRKGQMSPVEGQLNIVDVIPGDAGYNDFWQVNKVTVPTGYTANSIGSLQAIEAAGYPVEQTTTLVNCPIVPSGSTARHRLAGNDTGLHTGWYRNKVVTYFTFGEAPLAADGSGRVPVSPIYVAFNTNPGMAGGGPPSGFKMVAGTAQTHNVLATLPGDMDYSPLWSVQVYDSMSFDKVINLSTAMSSMAVAAGSATVNCPVFSVTHGMM
jgi:hypothetical protein